MRGPSAAQQPGFQVAYADQVRCDAGIMTMTVGQIRTAAQAEAVLVEGRADLVALGRELLLNPFWPASRGRTRGDATYALLPPQYAWWLERRARGSI